MQRSLSFALRIRNLAAPFTPLGATLAMDNNNRHQRRTANSSVESNPGVQKLQQLVNTNPSAGWEESWKQGVIPWDLGLPTPVILHLRDTGSLPMGRALVPGCGTGYDVVAMACPGRYVVGLDISEEGIKKAKQMSSSSPNADYFTFLKEDFFSWRPTDLFDLIFDYTFFCAIEPCMRSAWAQQIQNLLKPDGELITLMFPMDDHAGGPPYKVAIEDYEEVLHPMGFKAISIVDNELAIEARKVKRMEDEGGKGKWTLLRPADWQGKREAWKMEKSCRQLLPMNCDNVRWLIEQPCEGVLEPRCLRMGRDIELKIKGN